MANYPVRAGVAQNITPKTPKIQEQSKRVQIKKADKSLNWYLGWK